jgi:hypothetical protein
MDGRRLETMSTITRLKQFAVILVFNCKQAEQGPFSTDLATFIDQRMRPHAGYVSASVYLSDSGRQIVEVIEWESHECYRAYRESIDGREAWQWLSERHPQIWHTHAHAVIPSELTLFEDEVLSQALV